MEEVSRREVEVGEVGVVIAKGPQVMKEYYKGEWGGGVGGGVQEDYLGNHQF